ncbi:uncharacterized protein [Antedon mediterranea]|uniref:uncharacterized protein n=1 Tax=Antedon mediterranea TaxID=105859 RepID=UPI003AF764B3
MVACSGEDSFPLPMSYTIYFDGIQQKLTNENEAMLNNDCVNITCFVENTVGTGSDTELCPKDIVYPEKQTGLQGGAVAGITVGVLLFCVVVVVGVVVIVVLKGMCFLPTSKSGTFSVKDTGENKCEWPGGSNDSEQDKGTVEDESYENTSSNWI